jgi:hypothetical protein
MMIAATTKPPEQPQNSMGFTVGCWKLLVSSDARTPSATAPTALNRKSTLMLSETLSRMAVFARLRFSLSCFGRLGFPCGMLTPPSLSIGSPNWKTSGPRRRSRNRSCTATANLGVKLNLDSLFDQSDRYQTQAEHGECRRFGRVAGKSDHFLITGRVAGRIGEADNRGGRVNHDGALE